MRLVVLGILVAGCGFTPVRDGDGGAADLAISVEEPDLAGLDLFGVDLARSDLARAGDLATTGCALPQLLVTVENLKNPSTGGGRVARLALGDGSALPVPCASLEGQGLITPQPFSVAWIPTGGVAVMTRDALHLVNPDSDTIVWNRVAGGSNWFPVDVFHLRDPSGNHLVAAGWNTGIGSPPLAIRVVETRFVDGTNGPSWTLNAVDLPLGLAIYGMTTNPFDPTHFFAVDGTGAAAWDVNPWNATKSEYRASTGAWLTSIYSLDDGTLKRTVWVDNQSPTAVYYANDNGTGMQVSGPVRCTGGCVLQHAVPDPTQNTRFFGLCDGSAVNNKRVVRFSSTGGACDTVIEGVGFGTESRLSRLGIAK